MIVLYTSKYEYKNDVIFMTFLLAFELKENHFSQKLYLEKIYIFGYFDFLAQKLKRNHENDVIMNSFLYSIFGVLNYWLFFNWEELFNLTETSITNYVLKQTKKWFKIIKKRIKTNYMQVLRFIDEVKIK